MTAQELLDTITEEIGSSMRAIGDDRFSVHIRLATAISMIVDLNDLVVDHLSDVTIAQIYRGAKLLRK